MKKNRNNKSAQPIRFLVTVTFYSTHRNTVPSAGYRPHLVLDHDPEEEYLGVVFYDIEVDALDRVGYGMCTCLYESEHVNYCKIQEGKTFTVREGPYIVGKGKVVNLTT